MTVLEQLERRVSRAGIRRLSLTEISVSGLDASIENLRAAAHTFLHRLKQGASVPDPVAMSFAQECVREEFASVVLGLVQRDGRVLRMSGNDVVPGPAFNDPSSREPSDPDAAEPIRAEPDESVPWPKGFSYRVGNLYRLNQDLVGDPAVPMEAHVDETG
mgnify:CR=1 FL=1